MKYKILHADTPDDLTERVNNQIGLGWTPLGGVSSSNTETDELFYSSYAQAMVQLQIFDPEEPIKETK